MAAPQGKVKKFIYGFFFACVLILLVDSQFERHHLTYTWENHTGFYGAYGFFSCVILVYIAKFGLRPLIMEVEAPQHRGEDGE